jgi:ABC-2 type transport system permease protein
MLYLLQLEWLKLKHTRLFRVLMLLYIVLLPTLMLVGKGTKLPDELGGSNFYMFPNIWYNLAYIGNWLVSFFFGFWAASNITTEFEYRTLRQNIMSGLSREAFFFSKVLSMLAVSLVAALYFALVGLLYGYAYTDYVVADRIVEGIPITFRYALMCFSYMVFAFTLGVLFRRTGLSLFIYISYLLFLELVIRWVVHKQLINNSSMLYYPMNATEDLAPMPFQKIAQSFKNNDVPFEVFLTPSQATYTVTIYVILFLMLGYYLIIRKDL